MLKICVYPQLRTWKPNMIFQLDGAPAHWGFDVRAFLNAEFPNRWSCRDGPTPWPPRSPVITPLYLFSMGRCEDPGIHISCQ